MGWAARRDPLETRLGVRVAGYLGAPGYRGIVSQFGEMARMSGWVLPRSWKTWVRWPLGSPRLPHLPGKSSSRLRKQGRRWRAWAGRWPVRWRRSRRGNSGSGSRSRGRDRAGYRAHAQQTATQQFVSSINQAVTAASNLTVLNTIAQGLSGTTQKLNNLATQGGKAIGDNLGGGARTGAAGLNAAHDAAAALTQEQQKLVNQNLSVITGAGTISKAYGTGFTGALALADLAGVKLAGTQVILGKNANVAGVQIEALVQGYAAMDQTGGILANSMDAVNVQIGLQDSKVQQLNQGWDQFIQLGTGLTGGFASLQADLQQIGNIAPVVGSKISAFSGKTSIGVQQVAQSLTSFSGKSAQTWQSYNASITQANSFTDSLRTAAAAGAVTQGQFQSSIASVVGELLPYAQYSSAARSELSMIAQEAAARQPQISRLSRTGLTRTPTAPGR